MSFSCFSIELEKLLNTRKLPYKIINTQRIRLKNLKKWSTNVTQKVIHKRYSKVEPQALLKNWPSNVTQKWSTNVTQKLTQKRYSIVSNKHGIEKSSKTNTLSWLFFDWKIAATSYKKFKTTLWNINYQL